MRPDKILYALACVASLGIAGCGNKDDGKKNGPEERFESSHDVVRFKRNARIRADFSNALALDPSVLCNELGLYSCTDLVHSVALGAVEPYNIGLYEPLPRTGVTSPIIVDRVALAGCTQRVDLDLASPSAAVLFRGLPIAADGRLLDLEAAAVSESVDTIYRRALQRRATAEEIEHLKGLYADVEAETPSTAARDWAVLSCFAVLTTLESVFY